MKETETEFSAVKPRALETISNNTLLRQWASQLVITRVDESIIVISCQ